MGVAFDDEIPHHFVPRKSPRFYTPHQHRNHQHKHRQPLPELHNIVPDFPETEINNKKPPKSYDSQYFEPKKPKQPQTSYDLDYPELKTNSNQPQNSYDIEFLEPKNINTKKQQKGYNMDYPEQKQNSYHPQHSFNMDYPETKSLINKQQKIYNMDYFQLKKNTKKAQKSYNNFLYDIEPFAETKDHHSHVKSDYDNWDLGIDAPVERWPTFEEIELLAGISGWRKERWKGQIIKDGTTEKPKSTRTTKFTYRRVQGAITGSKRNTIIAVSAIAPNVRPKK